MSDNTSRRVGSLVDPRSGLKTVQTPDSSALTANVDQHIQDIQSNAMKSYSSLLSVIDNQTNARLTDYSYKMNKAQSEANNGSSELGAGIASIGEALISGYSAYQEADLKAKQIDYEIKAAQQDAENKRLTEQEKLQAEQLKQSYEETSANMMLLIDDTVTKANQYIQDYGWDKGTELAQKELDQVMSSDIYKSLPAEKRVEIMKYYRSHWDSVQRKQTDYVVDQKDKVRANEIDKTRSFIKMGFGGDAIAQIRNGIDPNEAINKFNQNLEAWKEQLVEQNGGQPVDPDLLTEILNPIYKDVADAMTARYGDDAKNYTEAYKYVELEQYNAALEIAISQGIPDPDSGEVMTESKKRALVKTKAIQLGIPGYTDSLELANDTITKRQITQLEQAKALENLLNDNTSPVQPDTVAGNKAISASQGGLIYSSINGDAGSKSLIAHIKNNRDKYPSHLQNIPEQVDEFNTDRKTYQELSQKLIQLEGGSYKKLTETNPETLGQRRTVVPGDSDLGTSGGYEDITGTPGASALPQEREALLKEMELLKSQQVELITKWANFGLDIKNPSNRGYLDQLEIDSAAVSTEAGNRYVASENTRTSTTKTEITNPQTAANIRKRAVNNASKKNRTKKWKDGKLRSDKDIGMDIMKDANEVGQNTNDTGIRMFYGYGLSYWRDEMDNLEVRLANGEDPEKALIEVKKEYKRRLGGQFGQTEFQYTNKPGQMSPIEYAQWFENQFNTSANKFVNSYRWYLKEIGESTRERTQPTNPNPSQSRQDKTGDAAYSTNNRVSPDKSRQIGQPSVVTNNTNGRSPDGLPLPVSGNGTSTYIMSAGDGKSKLSGITVTSKNDQVMSLQGGTVIYSDKKGDGYTVIIKTPDGRYEGYSNLSSPYFKVGDKVKPNQNVGKAKSVDISPTVLGKNPRKTSGYGLRTHPVTGEKGKMHQGIDFVNDETDDITTVQGGTVVYAGDANDNYGNTVIIKTPDGRWEQYSHLAENKVKVGDTIAPGTLVGLEGDTGRVTGKHLHFEVHTSDPVPGGKRAYNSTRINPEDYLNQFQSGGGTRTNTSEKEPSKSKLAGKTHVEVVRTNRKRENGSPIVKVRVFEGTKLVKEYDAVSGQPDKQTANTNISGNKAPAPNGIWIIGNPYASTTPGVGSTFIPMNPQFQTNRQAIGLHYQDYAAKGGDKGTAGCIGFINQNDMKEFQTWLKNNPNVAIEVALNQTIVEESEYKGRSTQSTFNFSVWNQNPLVGNGSVNPSGDNPVDYLRTLTRSTGNSQYNNTGNRQYSSGYYQISKDTYLLPNGMVLDMKTGKLRKYNNEKTTFIKVTRNNDGSVVTSAPRQEGKKEKVLNPSMMPISKEAYKSQGRVKNDPTSNHGYDIFAKDPAFSRATAKAADELGIPAVWLADIFELESDRWTQAKGRGGTNNNYWGLIQISTENLKYYGYTPSDLKNMSLADQVTKIVLPYLKDRRKMKDFSTFEDVYTSIWGSPAVQKMTPEQRRNITDGFNSIVKILDRMGANAGRKYNHSYRDNRQSSRIHEHVRGNCPTCSQMVATSSFVPHREVA